MKRSGVAWTVSLFAATVMAFVAPTASAVAAPSQPAATSVAACTFTANFTLSPGVTLTPSTFRFTTGGETATVTCIGSVNGAAVTGPGTYGEQGVIENGNCATGSGEGTYSAHIPTTAGMQHVKGTFDLTYVGFIGTETGPNITATFEYIPTEGNCLTTPLTGFTLIQEEELRSNS